MLISLVTVLPPSWVLPTVGAPERPATVRGARQIRPLWGGGHRYPEPHGNYLQGHRRRSGMTESDTGRELLWTPSKDRIQASAMSAYRRWLEHDRGLRFAGYEDLWRWSVGDLDGF